MAALTWFIWKTAVEVDQDEDEEEDGVEVVVPAAAAVHVVIVVFSFTSSLTHSSFPLTSSSDRLEWRRRRRRRRRRKRSANFCRLVRSFLIHLLPPPPSRLSQGSSLPHSNSTSWGCVEETFKILEEKREFLHYLQHIITNYIRNGTANVVLYIIYSSLLVGLLLIITREGGNWRYI